MRPVTDQASAANIRPGGAPSQPLSGDYPTAQTLPFAALAIRPQPGAHPRRLPAGEAEGQVTWAEHSPPAAERPVSLISSLIHLRVPMSITVYYRALSRVDRPARHGRSSHILKSGRSEGPSDLFRPRSSCHLRARHDDSEGGSGRSLDHARYAPKVSPARCIVPGQGGIDGSPARRDRRTYPADSA